MPRERCHLTKHALLDSIPLRMGRTLEGAKLYLENVELDPDGAASAANAAQSPYWARERPR